MLDAAVAQPGDRAALGAVDLELDQLVTVDPDGPRGVDLGDDPALDLEDPVRGVVGGRVVRLAGLVPALVDVVAHVRGDRGDLAEDLLQHVVPVREHVDRDPAAVGGPVVPGGALGGLPVALEDPVAELAAYGQDAAEEAALDEPGELAQAGQEELVLYDAVLDAGRVGQPGQVDRGGDVLGDRLLGVDVLACVDSGAQRLLPLRGHLGVEVDVDVRPGQHRRHVGAPVGQPVPLGDLP
ncbi:hypothetical protein Prum_047870 [Phytohabitans rumicis]|uniref:Uncharacterized protein n=1 Tax=Phytohabitans rumicis TaxID=1076125 RepID=A0A6V8LER6_9ACTN|nr:hypothetical protein Prum_047870 [Phytohabitans rumicis]